MTAALILGGGGSRGAYQVGVLRVLAESTSYAAYHGTSAVEARAVGGPVAETAALHFEAVARSLSDLAVAAGVTALAVFVTEGEQ